DLPGRVGLPQPPPTGPEHGPLPGPPPGPGPQPPGASPAQPLYDWERGVRLPDHEMTELRTLFHRWVRERIDLSSHLIFTGPGTPESVLNAIFSEVSFVIANAPGALPGPHRVRFDIPHSSAGLRLLLAARWFSQHGHWDPAHP